MFDSLARRAWLSLFSMSLVLLSGCSSVDGASNRLVGMIKPYKIDIVQGNFVSREQAAALKEGMSRNQVREILGSPLLASIFHSNRWDYLFTFKRQGAEPQARRVTVFFKDDILQKVEADALPSEVEFVASLDSGRSTGKVPVLEMSEESLKATAKPEKTLEPQPLPQLPPSYPPLEAGSN
jgi:outer membrane protein assembly factor BamE